MRSAIWLLPVTMMPASAIAAPALTSHEAYIVQSLTFQSAASEAALRRLYDVKLNNQKRLIASQDGQLRQLRLQIGASGAAASAARTRADDLERLLAAEKAAFNDMLAARDAEFARERDRFAAASARIFETRDGAAALELLLLNTPEAARQARDLLYLAADREAAADARASALRNAARLRDIAIQVLDQRDKGNLTITDAVTAWEKVVAADPGTSPDWVALARLYPQITRFPDADHAIQQAKATASTNRERAIAESELAGFLTQQGRPAQAIEAYRRSIALTKENDGENANVADENIAIYFSKMGDIFSNDLKFKEARESYEQSSLIRRQIIDAFPDNSRAQRGLGIILGNIADLLIAEQKPSEALLNVQQSFEIFDKLSKKNPEIIQFKRDLSIDLDRLGRIKTAIGDFSGALLYYTRGLNIAQELLEKDPTSAAAKSDVALSFDNIGDTHIVNKNIKAALKNYLSSLLIRRELAAAAPESAEYQNDLAASLQRIGDIALANRDFVAANDYYQDSLIILERVSKWDPDSTIAARNKAALIEKVAESLRGRGDDRQAVVQFQRAFEIFDKLAQSAPTSAQVQRDLLGTLTQFADLKVPGFNWSRALSQAEIMQSRGLIAKADEPVIEQIRVNAAAERKGP